MNDILSPNQAKARGLVRPSPRPNQSTARPTTAYQQVYSRDEPEQLDDTVTEEVTVTTVTTVDSPMLRQIETLSLEEKAAALQRARLQAEGAMTAPRPSLFGEQAFDALSGTVSSTVTKIVKTTKHHVVPRLKSSLSGVKRLRKLPVVNQPIMQKYGLFAVAGLMVIVTGYVSIDTLMTNRQLREQTHVASNDAPVVAGDSDTNALTPTDASQEGQEETDVSRELIAQYNVAPDMPRVLSIPKIGVYSRVIPMGTNADKSIQSPVNVFDSGWYTGSSKPGENGAMFIDGHASGATRMGLFAYLDTLEKGDQMTVEKGDGNTLTYEVVHKETIPLSKVNMTSILATHKGVEKGLNLMTCTGEWIESKQTYDHRVVVYTKQV